MDLKKGLSLVAFGFFFTLVNFNLTLNGATLNVTPDFIGWILLFLAYDKLGKYTADKKYIKWLSLLLIVMTAAVWLSEIVKPELDVGTVRTFNTVLSGVYMFFLFGSLVELARDYGSQREGILGVLKYLNPALLLGFVAVGIAGVTAKSAALTLLAGLLGVAALAAAIVTMVVLFQLRKEISDKLADE